VTESDFPSFEAVGALVVVFDGDGQIVYWNRPCSELTGYSLSEVCSRQFGDQLLVPAEVERVRAAFAQLRDVAPPSRFAHYWVKKSGERRWICWSSTLTKHPCGQLQYIISTGSDQTEGKHAEEALRASEAKLGGIISIAADAIISIDDQQRIVMYNQGATEIFGWSAAEVMGKPVAILLPERFRDLHGQQIRSFSDGEIAARQMGQHRPAIFGRRKNGEEFPAQAAISKLDVDGSRLFTVVLRDITEQQQREKDRRFLAAAGEALAATLDYEATLTCIARLAVQDLAECCIVDLVDAAGKLWRVRVLYRAPDQAALCELLPRTPLVPPLSSLVGAAVEARQPCLMTQVSSLDLESLVQGNERLRALWEHAPRSLIAVPLLSHGELLGALVIVAGRPPQRYGQAELHLAEEFAYRAAVAIENARLYENTRRATCDLLEANQQMVSATIRAQELTEAAETATARLEQSERELLAVAEFREVFIGIVGHDLRNPLNSIVMASALLLQRGRLDAQDQKTVTRIVKSSHRMTRLITQLLDLTRVRLGGGFPLEPQPVDLREVCTAVVEEFAAQIELAMDGDLTGTWDSDRLAEALSNIAGNGIEHAAPGTALSVKAHAEGAEVVVAISNQGSPIPAAVLPFIFEPFRRAMQHEKSAAGNLGLGLYIANQIVLSHGGTLTAHSALGTTTFVMRLPRAPTYSNPPAS